MHPNLCISWKLGTQGLCSRLCDRMASVSPWGGVTPLVPRSVPYSTGRMRLGTSPARGVLSTPVLGHPSASPRAVMVNVPAQERIAALCEYPNPGPWWEHMVANNRMDFMPKHRGGVMDLLRQEEEVGEQELLFFSFCSDRCYRHISPLLTLPGHTGGGTRSLQRKEYHRIASSPFPSVTKIPPEQCQRAQLGYPYEELGERQN